LPPLKPAESAALLSAVAYASGYDAPPGDFAAVRLCALKLLRVEAARVEHQHADAVIFGMNGGVLAAVHALMEWLATAAGAGSGEGDLPSDIARQPSPDLPVSRGDSITRDGSRSVGGDEDSGDSLLPLRGAVEGAAALADLVAAAGANKSLALALGGVDALVRCLERLTSTTRHVHRHLYVPSADGDEGDDDVASLTHVAASATLKLQLAVQACRALGNLTFGWDVEPIKEAIGPRGAAAVASCWLLQSFSLAVTSDGYTRIHTCTATTAAASSLSALASVYSVAAAAAALFRWQSHALRNFCVRSSAMQDAVGGPASRHHLPGLGFRV
jgi:hypothetical protein